MIVFKKGSLVPRRLGIILTSNKRAQHHLRFGVDVSFDGKVLGPVKPMGQCDAIIIVDNWVYATRKNGTRQKSSIVLSAKWIIRSHQDPSHGEYSAEIVRSDCI